MPVINQNPEIRSEPPEIRPPESGDPGDLTQTQTDGVIYRDGQAFLFNIYLQTFEQSTGIGIGDIQFKFNPLAIQQLVIEEDLLSWYTKGYIIFQTNFEGAQTSTPLVEDPPTFRMDGRDLLVLNIKPIFPDGVAGNSGTGSGSFSPQNWELKYECVIYDVEDIPTENPIVKLRKAYFRDFRYQLLSEMNIEFSTALSQSETMTTGAVLSSVLIEAFSKSPYNFGKISQTDWDVGESQLFYTSPANYKVLDDIDYILERHVAKTSGDAKDDLCLFNLDRYTKEFQLIPFTNIYKKSTNGAQPGEYQIEHFFLQTHVDDVIKPLVLRAPLDNQNNNTDIDVKLDKYGLIMNYRFVDLTGGDNAAALVNRPVYSYEFGPKLFHCESKENYIVPSKDYFNKNYVQKLYGKSGHGAPILPLNRSKKDKWNLETVYSTKETKDERLNDGRNKNLYGAIYLNETIAFDIMGMTNRKSGRFIAIDRHTMANDNDNDDFDNKFLGQWLTTNIKHVFTQTNYINSIIAVKIHSFVDLKINEGIF